MTITELINVAELEFNTSGYADIVPSIIPNTTMRARSTDGGLSIYTVRIAPANSYVMHDSACDGLKEQTVIDEETGEEVVEYVPILGYTPAECSVGASYDFSTTEMLDEAGNTVTAYGSRQFFCKLATDVPTDQIFGVVDQPEVI